MVGGRGRDRTGDPLLAKQVLSQLSYTPTVKTCIDVKAFASVRKLQKPTFYPLLCQNCVKTSVTRTLLCQNSRHFVGPAFDFVQRFPLHLQLHLRVLLEHLGIALTKHLDDPFVCHASGVKGTRPLPYSPQFVIPNRSYFDRVRDPLSHFSLYCSLTTAFIAGGETRT